MSIAESPIFGHMSKSMANFTVYTLNGKNIVRSKAFMPKDPKSKKQLAVRSRIAALGKQYRMLSPILCLGFPENSDNKTPQNMFVAANFSTAFELLDEQPVLQYPLMLISKGSLPELSVTDAALDAQGITISYDATALLPEMTGFDEIIAFAMMKNGALHIVKQILGFVTTGSVFLKLKDKEDEEVACCYVFVRSGDGKKSSNSVFVEVNT